MTDNVAANDVEAAIVSRRAMRGFLPDPLARGTIDHLLNVAARAPSGTNMQPWRVIALAGDPLAAFTAGMVEGFPTETTGSERPYYPSPQPSRSQPQHNSSRTFASYGIESQQTKPRSHQSPIVPAKMSCNP